MAFVGYELKEDGQYREIEKASTISEVQIKVDDLKKKLEDRKAHYEIFKYCTTELLQNNYFHAVLEANKGLFQRIRDLSGILTDGIALIEQVFSTNPILIINNYQTSSEKNEHNGFCNLLKGLCAMFRNPTAHEPKIDWDIKKGVMNLPELMYKRVLLKVSGEALAGKEGTGLDFNVIN